MASAPTPPSSQNDFTGNLRVDPPAIGKSAYGIHLGDVFNVPDSRCYANITTGNMNHTLAPKHARTTYGEIDMDKLDLSNVAVEPWELVRFRHRAATWTFEGPDGTRMALETRARCAAIKALPRRVADHFIHAGVAEAIYSKPSTETHVMEEIVKNKVCSAFPESLFKFFHVEERYLFVFDAAFACREIGAHFNRPSNALPVRMGSHEITWPDALCISEIEDSTCYILDPLDEQVWNAHPHSAHHFAGLAFDLCDPDMSKGIEAYKLVLEHTTKGLREGERSVAYGYQPTAEKLGIKSTLRGVDFLLYQIGDTSGTVNFRA